MVAVWMVTYNHGEFIENAIESVMMQKSTFKYKLFIGEDNSTDKTREICKKLQEKYTDRIELILHEKNIGANSNGMYMYKRCLESGSKYIALLEGDDYWIDSNKLQSQIDFLEANPDFSICWTDYKVQRGDCFENNEWEGVLKLNSNKIIDLNNFGYPYCTYTLTACFKKEIFDNVNYNNFKYFKDNSIYILALLKGKGLLMNKKTAVYRKHSTSIYSANTLYAQCLDNFLNLSENLVMFKNTRNEHFAIYFNYTKNELKKNVVRFSRDHLKVKILILKFFIFFFLRDINFLLKIFKK